MPKKSRTPTRKFHVCNVRTLSVHIRKYTKSIRVNIIAGEYFVPVNGATLYKRVRMHG